MEDDRHPDELGGVPEPAGSSAVASGPGLADLADLARSEMSLRRFLHGLPGVDQVGAEPRAAEPGDPFDQGRRQALGDRHGYLDGRPHHAGGRGHSRQSASALRQGPPARPRGPERPAGRGRLRLPRPRTPRQGRPRRQPGQGGLGGHRLPLRTGVAGGQARRRRRRGRRGGRRGGHGHRPRRLPGRPLRAGARRGAGGEGKPAATRTSR